MSINILSNDIYINNNNNNNHDDDNNDNKATQKDPPYRCQFAWWFDDNIAWNL